LEAAVGEPGHRARRGKQKTPARPEPSGATAVLIFCILRPNYSTTVSLLELGSTSFAESSLMATATALKLEVWATPTLGVYSLFDRELLFSQSLVDSIEGVRCVEAFAARGRQHFIDDGGPRSRLGGPPFPRDL
jgi:hypothetical protein